MRVFCAVRHSCDPGFYYGGLWSGNFYPALQQLGHEIVDSDVDLLPLSRFMHVPGDFTREELAARADLTQRILDEVRAAHQKQPIDLFLSYFYNAHFDPAGFDELRRLGIPTVNFYCNSIYQFSLVAEIAAKVDYSWHPERDATSCYRGVGGNPVRVQFGADPNLYRPIDVEKRKRAACFIGQRYADRDRWLAALHNADVPFDVYGNGWTPAVEVGENIAAFEEVYLGRKHHRPGSLASYINVVRENILHWGVIGGLSRTARQWHHRRETQELAPLIVAYSKGRAQNIATTLAAYDVCLNFSNVWADGWPGSALIPHVRLRDFEAPMCRTCYLTGHTDEIEEFYEVGREIDTYRTSDELVEKTKFYLNNQNAAERLRAVGYERARRDHIWVRRFEELFLKIGLHSSEHTTVSVAT